jgi:twitching motility protein PilU
LTAHLIFDWLAQTNQLGGSDLYLTVGRPPTLRIDSRMENLRSESISRDEINAVLDAILTKAQRHNFETHHEHNSSLDLGIHGRFRVNILRQRQYPALVIRRVISQIPNFTELNLPPIMAQLSGLKRGLVMITGMTGSGKSTTLASMIDYRNSRETGHIVTLEDPIEYFHEHKKSIVTQREIGVDTESYEVALKNVLRQRPDVILIGEIRDTAVMEQALLIAETGHLCLATLHTNNAYQAIERMINLFPEEQAQQARLSLAMNLQAIVAQRLIPDIKGGTQLAIEVMLNQGLVRELILEGKITKIRDVMEQNISNGMISFDHSLYNLYTKGLITEEAALAHADTPADLRLRIKQRTNVRDRSDIGGLDTAGLTLTDHDDSKKPEGPATRRRI